MTGLQMARHLVEVHGFDLLMGWLQPGDLHYHEVLHTRHADRQDHTHDTFALDPDPTAEPGTPVIYKP